MTFFEWFYKAVIIESVCVIIIISGVVATKYFFKTGYLKAEEFYKTQIMSDTDIKEVLESEI